MSDGLVEFVRAQLARDEQAALAATPGPWVDFGKRPYGVEQLGYEDGHMVAEMQECEEHEDRQAADAEHIARHDPARVLAEVESKRAIVDQHRPSVERKSWDEDWTICGTCRYDCGLDTYPFPCPTLRALAQPYAGEPGWQEEWRL